MARADSVTSRTDALQKIFLCKLYSLNFIPPHHLYYGETALSTVAQQRRHVRLEYTLSVRENPRLYNC